MAVVARAGQRIRLAIAAVAAVLLAGVLSLAILPPGPVPSPVPSGPPTGTPSPSPSPLPAPTPLPGATNDSAIPDCPPDRLPARADTAPPDPPVAGPVDLRVVGRVGGTVGAALLEGSELLVGAGKQVVRLDVADSRATRELALSAPLPGSVTALARFGDLIVAATGEAGLAVLDPADRLSLIGSIDLPGVARDVQMVGSIALIADGPGGLRMVELANPAAPVEVAGVLDLHHVLAVAVSGERAYLAAADEGLVVVDISAPASPRVIGSRFTGGYAFGVANAGTQVLLADGWAGLRVIDPTGDAANPAIVATIPTSSWVMDVDVVEDRAYLAAGLEGMRVLDIADPSHPVELGAAALPGGHATGASASAGRAAVNDAGTGVRLYDVTGPSPVSVGIHAPLSTLNGIAVSGDRVFLAGKGQGLRIVDVSNPAAPVERPGVATQDLVWQVAVANGNVFFATVPRPESQWVGSTFSFDATAREPVVPGEPLGGGGGTATAVDGALMVTTAELSVWLLDGSRPEPCRLATIETKEFLGEGFEANGVTIAGDYAYLAPFYEAIRVVDIADPRKPRVLDRPAIGPGVGVGKTFAVGKMLYAIGRDDGGPILAVFSLADPRVPRLVGSVDLPAPTATSDQTGPQMAYGGGRLFVADEVGGLLAIDVSDPTRPAVAGRLRLPGDVLGVAVDGEHAYVASDGGGLFVVEWSNAARAALVDGLDGARGFVTDPPATSSDVPAGLLATWSARPDAGRGPALQDGECVVDVATDSGPGSLRTCLEGLSAGSRVTFDPAVFPPDRPTRITLARPLPVVGVADVGIDASNAGVIVDGNHDVVVGLELNGDRGTVSGLQVLDFAAFGIRVEGSGNVIRDCVVSGNAQAGITLAFAGPGNRILGNVIGLDASGKRIHGRQAVGVDLVDETIVGGPGPGDRNVISGNELEIFLKAVRGSVIEGNYIGTDGAGRARLRSPEAAAAIGVWVGSTGNRIADNVVAGDINVLDPGSSYNVIVGNHVGVDAAGRLPFEPGGSILVEEPFNAVGGTLDGEGNIVSDAIVAGATDVILLGNQVGVGAGGGAIGEEPRISVTKARAIVGGRAATAANVVRGAIEIQADEAIVIGNRIDGRGRATGIVVEDSAWSHVVANRVEGGTVGIHLRDGAFGNTIRGNDVRGSALRVAIDAASQGNQISGNAFVGGTAEARDHGSANAWDDGIAGNYWSGFAGSDADGDGLLDSARVVRPRGIDRFPLAEPP